MKQKHIIVIEVDYNPENCKGLTGSDLVHYVDYRLKAETNGYPAGKSPYEITDVTVYANAASFNADGDGGFDNGGPCYDENFSNLPLPLRPK